MIQDLPRGIGREIERGASAQHKSPTPSPKVVGPRNPLNVVRVESTSGSEKWNGTEVAELEIRISTGGTRLRDGVQGRVASPDMILPTEEQRGLSSLIRSHPRMAQFSGELAELSGVSESPSHCATRMRWGYRGPSAKIHSDCSRSQRAVCG